MTTETAHHEAHSEKQHAALSSLFWALFLTLIKLGAGLATNSLGILSEALHSSLDLVAAGITFFAVRVAARPRTKPIPMATARSKTFRAGGNGPAARHLRLDRARSRQPALLRRPRNHPSWWGVIIILISLLVDVNRAAMLRRVAQKHKSQALEADALHFTTDIWSSGVVLVACFACRPANTFRRTALSGAFCIWRTPSPRCSFRASSSLWLPALPPGRDHAA